VTASNSLSIQPTGPRTGDNGSKYFNIEGKDNDKYASFGGSRSHLETCQSHYHKSRLPDSGYAAL
jgi:hypothetical protein